MHNASLDPDTLRYSFPGYKVCRLVSQTMPPHSNMAQIGFDMTTLNL